MDFVIIANAWSAARDNPTSKHQLALQFAAQGHRVLWVEGAGMRRPSLGSGADRGRMVRKVQAALRGARREGERLWVLAPLLVPLPTRPLIRRFNGWWFRREALRWARRLGFHAPVLINYVPVLADAMRGWNRAAGYLHRKRCPDVARPVTVYHCVDLWDQFEMYDSAMMRELDRQCRVRADLVVVSSKALLDNCRDDRGRAHLVNHGVDHAHFAAPLKQDVPRPADLPAGPVIGFFGLLSEWMDQDLVVRTARECAGASVVLIGKADVPVHVLEAEPRIRILGPRPFADLPRYVAHFEVGIIPFNVSELTRAVNPIKLREMMAAGCPVVSTALPEVGAYVEGSGSGAGRGVVVAGDADAFVAAVSGFVRSPMSRGERQALSRRVSHETWADKAREIVALVEGGGSPDRKE